MAQETQNRIDALLAEAQTRANAIAVEQLARANALTRQAQQFADSLVAEARDRVAAIADEAARAVAALLQETQNRDAAISSEHTAWTKATGALAQSLETVSASTKDNTAAIQIESKARTDADNAEASLRVLLAARTKNSESGIEILNTVTGNQAISIGHLNTMAGNASSDITTLQNTSASQAQTLDQLSTRADGADSQITILKNTTTDQATAISSITTRTKNSETSISSLNITTGNQAQSISALSSRVGDAEGAISGESSVRLSQDNALVTAVQTMWAAIGGNAGLIQGGGAVTVNTAGATASTWNQVQAALKDGNGNLIASSAIKQTADALVTKSGQIESKWVVNVDSGGAAVGFRQAGFGLSGSSSANGPQYAFGVRADLFWIAAPGDAGQTSAPANKVPFIVKTGAWTDGRGYPQPAGVYLNDLFATTAKIGNAQITSAMIGDAQVNTLKIGANAVTVPFTATFPGETFGQGVGVVLNVASGTIWLDGPAMVFASSTGLIAYGGGWVSANSSLVIDGTQVSFGGGDEAWVNAAHSGGKFVDGGSFPRSVTVILNFNAQPGARIISPTVFIMGAKR